MAIQEAFTLDSLALNDQTTLAVREASAPPPRQRQDWVGAADSEEQKLVRNPLYENRKVTLRCVVIPQASMDLAHDKIALVLDKLVKASKYPDGIALTWTPATGTRTVTFDVLTGEITDLPIDWENGWLALSPQFTVELTCKPYWRGTETLTSTASSSTPFVTLDVSGVTGDVPALGRLIVTDTASQSRRHVEWGLEGPLTYGVGTYTAGTSLLLDSDNLVTSGFSGAQATSTGAYDPNASGNNSILTSIYGSPQAVCGTGNLTHVGVFRVKARVSGGSNPSGIYWRLAWRVGAGTYTTNDPVTTTTPGWVELDLGTVTIPQVLSGTQSWDARIEAYKPGSSDTVVLDYVTLIPVSDGYGKARATYSYTSGSVVGYDAFVGTTSGSALNARSAPVGGTWATSGDATDFTFLDQFTFADSIEAISRANAGPETNGRYAILGSTNYTDTEVSVRAAIYNSSVTHEFSVIARWVDSSNYLRLRTASSSTNATTYLEQVVAGTVTVLASATWKISSSIGTYYQHRLIAYTSGQAIGHIITNAGALVTELRGNSTALATAGALDDGKPGLLDRNTSAVGLARRYTNFTVAAPTAEPIVVNSGRNMQVRYDDTIRQDSTGTYTGRPQSYRGARFLVPVGTSRVVVKARRNDIEDAADDNVTDATQIQVGWTPRGLAVPR